MAEVDITLSKLKYRNPDSRLNKRQFDPPEGTYTFQGGKFGAKSSNQGTKSKKKTIAPRKRAYGPF